MTRLKTNSYCLECCTPLKHDLHYFSAFCGVGGRNDVQISQQNINYLLQGNAGKFQKEGKPLYFTENESERSKVEFEV